MDGVITWSTVKHPLTGDDSLVGMRIEDILYPGDAIAYRFSLLEAAFGRGFKWYIYSIKDKAFLALIEYLKGQSLFVIQEAEAVSREKAHIDYLKKQLWVRSGLWHQNFDKNGTE